MKAELQKVMNLLRRLQGAIDCGSAPVAEREELAGDVTDIMDALFEVMKKPPTSKPETDNPLDRGVSTRIGRDPWRRNAYEGLTDWNARNVVWSIGGSGRNRTL